MKIFAYCYNRPDYLKYQNLCLNKFIKEDFEFYCIDNSKDKKIEEEFKNICSSSNIKYLRNLKPDHSLEGTSHYAAMQWSWNEMLSKTNEIVVMIDHDNFPIQKVSILDLLGDNIIAGVPQGRGHVEYLNPALMIFDTSKMPNKNTVSFKGSRIEEQNTDIGGELYFYFRDNKDVKVNRLPSGPIEHDDKLICEHLKKYHYPHTFDLIGNAFMHPRNGSNWARLDPEVFKNRDKLIFSIIEENLNA